MQLFADLRVFLRVFDEHTRNEHRLRNRAFTGAGSLERFTGVFGEAVEVEAVVPVGTAYERQAVGTFMGDGITDAAPQMLHKGHGLTFVVIEGDGGTQDGIVPCLAQVCADSGDQPERVIIEAAAYVCVAFFGQGLILMVGAAVGELCRGDVDDPFAGTLRDQMHKAQEILAGIAESHAAADAGLIVGSASRHIESYHALVLIPDVDHAVNFRM